MSRSFAVESKCLSCGKAVPDGAADCPGCGEPLAALEPTHARASAPRPKVSSAGQVRSSPTGPTPIASSRRGEGLVLQETWELVEKLGAGGMGTVYRARDLKLDREVAIKLLSAELSADAEFRNRFEREARMMARLEHAHLLPIYAVGIYGDSPFIVMKLLQGKTLEQHLREVGRPLTPAEVLPLLRQLCAALAFIHSRQVVHRDIKPANIFLSAEGHLTVLDLGLVRATQDKGLTRAGMAMGTPGYMPPEQALGAADLDHRADLYPVGVMLHEMLSGAPPYRANSDFELMLAHRDRPIPRLSGVPPPLADLVARAMAKKKEQRVESAEALLAEFERVVASATAAPTMRQLVRAAPRSNRKLIGGAVGLALLAAAGFAVVRSMADPAPVAATPIEIRQRARAPEAAARAEAPAAPVGPVANPTAAVPPTSEEDRSSPNVPQARAAPPPAPAPPTTAPVASGAPRAKRSPAEAKIAGKGALVIHVAPWARVYVDDKELPSNNGMDAVAELDAGRHVLKVHNPTFGTYVETLTIGADRTVERSIDLRTKGKK